MTSRQLAVLSLALSTAAGCDFFPASPCAMPGIAASGVRANADNVLSAVVGARVPDADSAVVRFHRMGDTTVVETAAVMMTAGSDSIDIPVLGLAPTTAYSLRVFAYKGCAQTSGDELSFTTAALPADLPQYTASGSNPTPGFVAFSAGTYGLVIDNSGRVVWYHRFPNGPGLNFQPQPNGRYVARPAVGPGETGRWVEVDVLGAVTRSLSCARGLPARFHDMIAQPDGSWWTMCDETRTMDLSGNGGVANAQVMGTVIQHLAADGALLFEWSPFDHFAITDLDPADRFGASVNWTHGNAIDLDIDGNLIASFRSLNEITKIDTRTGALIWRMGGRANQFSFADAPFARQHGVRVGSSGELHILNNLGDPTASRAASLTVKALVMPFQVLQAATYASLPPVVAQQGGSTQELPGGHMLIAFGNGNRVEEYDAAGNVVWRIEGNPGYVFRAQRIRSLYSPGIGLPR